MVANEWCDGHLSSSENIALITTQCGSFCIHINKIIIKCNATRNNNGPSARDGDLRERYVREVLLDFKPVKGLARHVIVTVSIYTIIKHSST